MRNFSVKRQVLLNQTELLYIIPNRNFSDPRASTNVEFPDFAITTTNEIYDVIICTNSRGPEHNQ
jgi:hypothetical protein